MCTVYKWQFLPEIILCHCLIGDQHKIFNDLCCNISLIRLDLNRLSFFIKHDFCLWKIKIDRSAFHTFFTQNSSQFPHQFKHWNQVLILSDLIFVMIFENLFYTGITHAAVHFDHRLCDRVVDHISFRIDRHHTA